MMVWLVFGGIAEAKKRGLRRINLDMWDVVLFELWVVMKYVLPLVLVPITKFFGEKLCPVGTDVRLCSGMYVWWDNSDINEWQYPWINNTDGSPAFPAWCRN